MSWKKHKYQILIAIYSFLIFVYSLVVFSYAYFHELITIPHYQIYETAKLDIDVTTIPHAIDSYININKTPISKINDSSHDAFNQDVATFQLSITNNSDFAVKNLIDFSPSANNHYSLLYWMGVNVDQNYQELIINDIGSDNIIDFYNLKSSLESRNSTTIEQISEIIIPPREKITIIFVFWMEWDDRPSNLNLEFQFSLSLKTIQYNGEF